MKRFVTASVIVVGALALLALPAFSDSSGSVSAQVQIAATCVTVSPASVNFGTLPFTQNTTGSGPSVGSQPITVTNCSPSSENYLGAGTNAHGGGPTSTTVWTLTQPTVDIATDPCTWGPNQYEAGLGSSSAIHWLGTANTPLTSTWASATAGEVKNGFATILMPCQGSNGTGEIVGFSYTITAVPTS
jgi:hypothetical protein